MLDGVAGMEFDSNLSMALGVTWLHNFSPSCSTSSSLPGTKQMVRRRGRGRQLAGPLQTTESVQNRPLAADPEPEHGQLRVHHERHKEEPREPVRAGQQRHGGERQTRVTVRFSWPPGISEHPGPAEIPLATTQLLDPRDGAVRTSPNRADQPATTPQTGINYGQHVPRVFQLLGPARAQLVLPDEHGDRGIFPG